MPQRGYQWAHQPIGAWSNGVCRVHSRPVSGLLWTTPELWSRFAQASAASDVKIMEGKYRNWGAFMKAYAVREGVRARLRSAVTWSELSSPTEGCTAIIGMCHRLPNVLLGNLRCLLGNRWPELKEVIVVVDGERSSLPQQLEDQAIALGNQVPVRMQYYTAHQAKLADALNLPYVYAWLSWSIGLSQCRTRHALLQDYDALVFGDALAKRYAAFAESKVSMQGISWYTGNGVLAEDKLATTFEAFLDVPWVRSRHPLAAFHKVRYRDGRSFDYDTLLDLQHNGTPVHMRAAMPMDEENLVHPSQMIHQYTMFRRYPGKELPCYSIPMIPFFEFLSGDSTAIQRVVARLQSNKDPVVDLIGDGTRINTRVLTVAQVDWALKQMLRACLKSDIQPFGALYRYGELLYERAAADAQAVWKGDFTPLQRQWIESARSMSV